LIELYSLSEMQAENGREFRGLDYLKYVFGGDSPSSDASRCLEDLLVPRVVLRGDHALIASVGADEEYDLLVLNGVGVVEAQRRANRIDLVEVFGCSREAALILAEAIAAGWQKAVDLADGRGKNIVFVEEYTDPVEVFIGLISK
jgi:hypothetical protein